MVAAAPPVGPNSQEQHRRQRQKQQIAAWEAAVLRRRQHMFKRAAGGRVRSLPAPACTVCLCLQWINSAAKRGMGRSRRPSFVVQQLWLLVVLCFVCEAVQLPCQQQDA